MLLPWVLQGRRPEGELLEIGAGSGAMAAQLLRAHPGLMKAGDLEAELQRLPLTELRVRRSAGGLLVRFSARKLPDSPANR